MKRIATALAVGLTIIGTQVSAKDASKSDDGTQITRSEVPDIVLRRVETIAPGLVFTEWGVEVEGALRVYELGAFDPDGRHVEVDVLADGSLQEIEWEMVEDDLPVAVAMEFRRNHPSVLATFVEKSIRPDGVIVYEIEGRDKNGIELDIEIKDNGRALSSQSQLRSP